jgi:hypothetical protein
MGAWIAAVLLVGIAFVVWRAFDAVNRKRKLERIANGRDAAQSFSQFRLSLPEIPESDCSGIYRFIQGLSPRKDFPIDVADNIWEMYRLDQGTLQSEVESYLGVEDLPQLTPSRSVETAGDLAQQIYQLKLRSDVVGSNPSLERP